MNKTVLITGASGGIGSAVAEKFACLGYNVVINYNKNEKAALELCEKLKTTGNCNILAVKADISDNTQVDAMFSQAEKQFGGVDILINNAGISLIKMINDVTESEWDNIFDINTKSAYLCSKRAISYMVRNRWGRIINISSMWGICGASCEVPYSASKAALVGFTKALAKELAPSGITVNCIAPGLIETKMNAHLSSDELSAFVNDIPVMRQGRSFEVAHAASFFAHENSGYITAQTLAVDGGMT